MRKKKHRGGPDANFPYEGLICRLFRDVRRGNEVGPLMPVTGVGGLVE